jgi:tetratricopeptide (TPR) repeat protein
MPPKYHHMTSRYARLTPETIDHCVEVVRDATEVLHSHRVFDAVDFIVSAREILEAEQLLELRGADFSEGDLSAHSDWTLACVADAMQQASSMLRERGNTEMANLLHARELSALRLLAESPWCSPLVGYHDAFSTLLNDCRTRRDPAGIRYQASDIVHGLEHVKGANVLNGLRDLGWLHSLLGNRERAVDIFVKLLRHDPSDVWTHNEIAFVFARDLPELARAAAERALEIIGDADTRRIVPQLQRYAAELAGKRDGERPANAESLLEALRLDPMSGEKLPLRKLCKTVAPETADVVKKVRPPLPDAPTLRKIREGLGSLPRPVPKRPSQPVMPVVTRAPFLPGASLGSKVGRNDPCPCGSGKKHKRCCMSVRDAQ